MRLWDTTTYNHDGPTARAGMTPLACLALYTYPNIMVDTRHLHGWRTTTTQYLRNHRGCPMIYDVMRFLSVETIIINKGRNSPALPGAGKSTFQHTGRQGRWQMNASVNNLTLKQLRAWCPLKIGISLSIPNVISSYSLKYIIMKQVMYQSM